MLLQKACGKECALLCTEDAGLLQARLDEHMPVEQRLTMQKCSVLCMGAASLTMGMVQLLTCCRRRETAGKRLSGAAEGFSV